MSIKSNILILKIISINPSKKDFISNTVLSSCLIITSNLYYVLYYINISIYKLFSIYLLLFKIFIFIKKKFHISETFYIGERTGIRTPDTRLRRALLYPAELCTHIFKLMERETRFELATSTLARLRSTTELFPLKWRPGRDSNPRPPA